MTYLETEARALLKGAYDLHVHAAPDGFERSVDCVQAAREAAELGMAGIVLKDHQLPTVSMACLVNKVVPEVKSFGSVTISRCIGGFNPEAVACSARRGARIVWMPTLESEYFMHWGKGIPHLTHLSGTLSQKSIPGFKVIDDSGRITQEVREVLEVVRKTGVVLGLGHMSPSETMELIRCATSMGIEKIKVSHPQSASGLSLDRQVEAARLGAFMSFTYLNCIPGHGDLSVDELVGMMKAVGPSRTIMSSDGGQKSVPTPGNLMVQFVSALLSAHFDPRDIELMVRKNPAALLGE